MKYLFVCLSLLFRVVNVVRYGREKNLFGAGMAVGVFFFPLLSSFCSCLVVVARCASVT